MLCKFANTFPSRIAKFLERDRGLKRNFREETVTDLLIASLVGLEPLGIRVDFPDEPTTGGDMDWIFAAPLEINGGRYLRLILQAKRAQFSKLKQDGYWFYQHLDHGTPRGAQAQTLVSYAASSPDGKSTLPLYVFYHPTSALKPNHGSLPAIEGVNLVFASQVAPIVKGGCARKHKRVAYWRNNFMPLSEMLCWPAFVTSSPAAPSSDLSRFALGSDAETTFGLTLACHPDLVARRFHNLWARRSQVAPKLDGSEFPASPAEGIPATIRRSIAGETTDEERKQLKRPRVIFSTRLRRDDPTFALADMLTRPPES